MLLGTACAKRSSETAPPSTLGEAEGDDLAALERALAVREGQLSAYGLAPARDLADADRDASLQKSGGATGTTQPTSPPQPATAPQPQAGVAEDTDEPATAPRDASEAAGGSRCEQVCEIAAAICALEDQICGLVPRHRGDARYRAACERAGADCKLANEACHACTPT